MRPVVRQLLCRLALLGVAVGGIGCGSGSGNGNVVTSDATGRRTVVRSATAPRAPLPLHGRVVVLDPGHNGGNAGASTTINRPVPAGRGRTKACDTTGTETNDGLLTESRFNLLVAKATRAVLQRRGARVRLTRRTDTGVGPCINERAEIGNHAKADVVISIHADGGPPSGQGFHVICPADTAAMVAPSIVAPSLRLAMTLRSSLQRAGRQPADYIGSAGLDQRGDLGGLNLSTVPKVFVESGNMRSSEDAARLENAAWRARTALALADGVSRYLNQP